MADYKELLRRAISALPENNGAARRAVYEKARSALVGQLRAITPPLPARDITQHRLQLEDCIRQVEQEASEAVITLGREPLSPPQPTPAPVRPAAAEPPPAPEPRPAPEPLRPVPVVAQANKPAAPAAPVAPPPAEASGRMSIEDIISEATTASGAEVTPVEADKKPAEAPKSVEPKAAEIKPAETKPDQPAGPELRAMPAIVARAEANRTAPASNVRPLETSGKAPGFEPRRDTPPLAANSTAEPVRVSSRVEPSLGGQATARQQIAEPIAVVAATPVEAALSTVREVEVEPDPNEAQVVIERAIETLDREARGESAPMLPPAASAADGFARPEAEEEDAGFARADAPRGGSGLTIFLVVFAILLAGAGGAGFWAWREGYVDLEQMFGQASAPVVQTAETNSTTPTLDPVPTIETGDDAAAGPGNTAATPPAGEANAELSGLELDDRLEPTPQPVQPTGNETVLPSLSGDPANSEERLPEEQAGTVAASDPAASVDPAVLAGSQSLLLEASADGASGAVPFSGTVEWTEGVDELGLPTLKGKASIPARNLGVDITIRKNSDPSLPASHLMEVDFKVSDTFIGGTIANLPGILLKDQELVPGTALVGASARVVGNSFLFALSASPADLTANTNLLGNRRWLDLAIVYGTGRNAILTLEKDEEAQALFSSVLAAWAN